VESDTSIIITCVNGHTNRVLKAAPTPICGICKQPAENLAIKITYMRKVNWSLLRAGVPLIWKLIFCNCDSAPAVDLTLRISLPNYLDTGNVSLPEIAPGNTYEDDFPDLPWILRDFEAALQLTNRLETHLEVEVGGKKAKCPIELLTPDEWCHGVWKYEEDENLVLDSTVELLEATFELPLGGMFHVDPVEMVWKGTPPLQASTAALVMSENPPVLAITKHPQVTDIKEHAISLLTAITDEPRVSLADWVSGTPEQQKQVVRAVFAALHQLYPKAYHDIEKFSMEARSQRIRFPDELANKDGTRRHGATCVDFAVLMCAVLEACGLRPLFILVGTGDSICHALVGVWLYDPREEEEKVALLTNATEVYQYVSKGDILAVDVTEFSKGKNFRDACALGKDCLNSPKHFCYALDLFAVREEYGIKPLPWVPAIINKSDIPEPLQPLCDKCIERLNSTPSAPTLKKIVKHPTPEGATDVTEYIDIHFCSEQLSKTFEYTVTADARCETLADALVEQHFPLAHDMLSWWLCNENGQRFESKYTLKKAGIKSGDIVYLTGETKPGKKMWGGTPFARDFDFLEGSAEEEGIKLSDYLWKRPNFRRFIKKIQKISKFLSRYPISYVVSNILIITVIIIILYTIALIDKIPKAFTYLFCFALLFIIGVLYNFVKSIRNRLHAPTTSEDDLQSTAILEVKGDLWNANFRNVVRKLSKLFDHAPQNIEVLNILALSYLEINEQIEEAESLIEAIRSRKPQVLNNPDIMDTVAWLKYRKGEYEEAKDLLLQCIELKSSDKHDNFIPLYHLYFVYLKLGEIGTARLIKDEILSRLPENRLMAWIQERVYLNNSEISPNTITRVDFHSIRVSGVDLM